MRVTAAFSRLLKLSGVRVTNVALEPDRVVVWVALRRRRLHCPKCSYRTRHRYNLQAHESWWRHLDLGVWRLEVARGCGVWSALCTACTWRGSRSPATAPGSPATSTISSRGWRRAWTRPRRAPWARMRREGWSDVPYGQPALIGGRRTIECTERHDCQCACATPRRPRAATRRAQRPCAPPQPGSTRAASIGAPGLRTRLSRFIGQLRPMRVGRPGFLLVWGSDPVLGDIARR